MKSLNKDQVLDVLLARIHRPAATQFRWVRRNEDKPHRCPECHAVATWDHKHAGPRTRLRCPQCGVQWRYGERLRKGHGAS